MKTVVYSESEKITLIEANGFVVRKNKVSLISGQVISTFKESFAYQAGKKYTVDKVFDDVVKDLLYKANPEGGGGGFYTEGTGIDISGTVISLSHLGIESLIDPEVDKVMFWDESEGAVKWGDMTFGHILATSTGPHTGSLPLADLAPGTAGDIITRQVADWAVLEKGAQNHVLRMGAIYPGWAQLQHGNLGGVTANQHHSESHALATLENPHTGSLPLVDLAAGTAGDIITRQAADWAVLAKGTETYVLTMGATYPEWAVPTPAIHALGGSRHSADTLANLNSKISDATLYKWEADQGTTKLHGDNVVYGSAASTACVGNDSRLSDSRTPVAHAMDSDTYHTSTDITVLNATTSKHGFLKKLGGGTTNFLRADGAWAAPPGSGMVYPGAGIALSTGSAWGTSITNNSANWNTAYGHSQIAGGNSVHVSTTENTQWDTAYSHSQSSSQAHTDYMLNTGDTASGTYNFDSNTLVVNHTTHGVGIGTASPALDLDVSDTGAVANLGVIRTDGKWATLFGSGAFSGIAFDNSVYFKIAPESTRTGTSTAGLVIDSTGKVGINDITPSYTLDVNGTGRFTGICTGANFALSSDIILKKDVVPLGDQGLDLALKLNPVTFYWKDKNRGTQLEVGFIANEAEKVWSSLVNLDTEKLKILSYFKITAINNAGIHGLYNKFESVEERVDALEQQVESLEEENVKLKDKIYTLENASSRS